MKKTIWVVLLSMAFALVGCKYDDSELQDKVKGIDERVTALEQRVQDLNTTATGIQTALNAVQNQLYVSKVVVNRDADGNPVTYDITFSDGTSITLVKGLKGDQGDQGPQGDQGETGPVGPAPQLGVQEIDGLYYWTVEGELLTDAEGNPIPIVGPQGVTPKFKIEEGSWWVSYDNEATWERVGLVSDSETSVIVTQFDDYIELDINGVKVNIPKEKPFTLVFAERSDLAVTMGATVDFPYTIEGVSDGEETEVDVYSVMGTWTAEAVATDAKSGVVKVTNPDNSPAKIFVYATNHKGKTDMLSLTFEGGVLIATIEVKDIEAAGGSLDLQVEYNVDYEIVVPEAAAEWLEVAPATKATEIKDYVLTVAPNETGSYRTATVQVMNKQTGTSAKDIDVLQYANPDVPTDLASVVALPDEKGCIVNAVTVVATSKESSIITDGTTFSYVNKGEQEIGTVIDIIGTKKTDDLGLAFIDATSVAANTEATPVEINWKNYYAYYGYAGNYSFTANNGVISLEDGTYYATGFADPQRFVIETPTQDLTSLVGKMAAMTGWIKTVDKTDGAQDIHIVLTSVRETAMAAESGWEPYYGGPNSGEASYPEIIGNEVSNASAGYYGLTVISKDQAAEYESIDAFMQDVCYNSSDDLLFNFFYYGIFGYDIDTIFGAFAHSDSAEESFSEFDYGQYYVVAYGLDEYGLMSGKYAYAEFEKVDPHVKAAYEDFLGTWTYTNSETTEVWTFTEKVKGESYYIDGFSGVTPEGGVLPEAIYDAEKGNFTVSRQDLGTWIYEDEAGDIEELDQLKAVWYGSSGNFNNNDSYMLDDLIFTGAMLEDGTVDVTPSKDDYGDLEGFAFYMNGSDGLYSYGVSTKIPGTLVKGEPEVDEGYTKWLGTWTIGGTNYTIAQNQLNASYTMGSFYSGFTVNAIVDYDKESGNILFKFGTNGQSVTASGNSYALYMSGITNQNYVAEGDPDKDGLIATFEMGADGASATITPAHYTNGDAEAYAVKIGMLGYSSAADRWANFGMIFDVPVDMTKASAAGAPSAKAPATGSISTFQKVSGAAPGGKQVKRTAAVTGTRTASDNKSLKAGNVARESVKAVRSK